MRRSRRFPAAISPVRGSLNHIIDIDQATFETVRPLILCAELQSVRLTKCKMDTNTPKSSDDSENIAMAVSTMASGQHAGEKIECSFSFTLNATHESADAKPLEISLTLEATYKVPPELTFSNKQIDDFASTNGMLNVWPYWREFVQSITSRAGLPPLTLPLFRIRIVPNAKAETPA